MIAAGGAVRGREGAARVGGARCANIRRTGRPGRERTMTARRATAGGVEGEGDGGRRRGRGRRRQAFGAAENRRRREMEATVRALVFIAPPFSPGWGGDPRLKGNL